MKKVTVKLFTALLAVIILLQCFICIGVSAAVSYSGSGTKASPYIVNTAEQLDGIRNNLSAHYKLGNTIDLSSIKNFKPIGTLKKPFTGSLTCDLNTDNTPKYAIKNLKIKVEATPYVAEKANKWEAALFGTANGATFSGIYMLDVDVTNNVQGDNTGALIYNTYKPGMDEMNSAALVGHAYSSIIMHCASTGKMDTKANWAGGLVGYSEGSTISDCYSTINVDSLGKWQIGGLVGGARDTIIERCFATGNISGGQTNVGGLVGFFSGSMTDCYATGNTEAGKEATSSLFSTQVGYNAQVENSYCLGNSSLKYEQGAEVTSKNCYAKKGTTHNMTDFKEASITDIKAAFKGLANWDVSGEYPTLTTIGVVKKSSDYKVGAGESGQQQTTPTETTFSQAQNTQSSVSGATQSEQQQVQSEVTSQVVDNATSQQTESAPVGEDKLAKIKELIVKIPDNPEEITVEHKETIKEIMQNYNALSDAEYNELDTAIIAKIEASYPAIMPTLLKHLTDSIEQLPEANKLKAKDTEKVYELWGDYELLNDEYKVYVSPKHLAKLEELVKRADELKESGVTETDSANLSLTERVIVIALFALIALMIAVNVFLIILVIRKYKKIPVVNDEFDVED